MIEVLLEILRSLRGMSIVCVGCHAARSSVVGIDDDAAARLAGHDRFALFGEAAHRDHFDHRGEHVARQVGCEARPTPPRGRPEVPSPNRCPADERHAG